MRYPSTIEDGDRVEKNGLWLPPAPEGAETVTEPDVLSKLTEDIVAAIAFVASDAVTYITGAITGATLAVYGG